jgi:hypothetical protein
MSVTRYAVSSFVPEAPYWCFHWPDAGTVDREAVLQGMPDPSLLTVHPLPCQHPAELHFQSHARWVVVAIEPEDYAERDGRVDFRRGRVIFNGCPREACAALRERGFPVPTSVRVVVSGDWETAEVGAFGVAVAGWDALARAGECGVAYANVGQAVAGDRGVAVSFAAEVRAGERGFAITLHGRSAVAGDGGLARADEFGTATAGHGGTAIADSGTASAGDSGLALAYGDGMAEAGREAVAFSWGGHWRGTVRAGDGGVLLVRWHDGKRFRLAVAHVREDGIEPDTWYRLDEGGRFVEASESVSPPDGQ